MRYRQVNLSRAEKSRNTFPLDARNLRSITKERARNNFQFLLLSSYFLWRTGGVEWIYCVFSWSKSHKFGIFVADMFFAHHRLDEKRVLMEAQICFKRAGADAILTYAAKKVAKWFI
jgi:hypothetical protein